MTKFMAASTQVADLDKERISMVMKIKDMEKDSSRRTGERMKLEDGVNELKNLTEEFRADIVEDTRLDHLQK